MSVFMAIKYPISVPPTAAQLEALPHEVYTQWMTEISLGEVNLPKALMANTLRRCAPADIRNAVERLQCIIYGLDE